MKFINNFSLIYFDKYALMQSALILGLYCQLLDRYLKKLAYMLRKRKQYSSRKVKQIKYAYL